MRKSKYAKKRVSPYEFMNQFETEPDAMEYIESVRWHDGRKCPKCNSEATSKESHETMPYWCKPCRKYFSVKTDTLMQRSLIEYNQWFMVIYLLSTSLKYVSSTELSNDIGLHQSSAWFMAHRIRAARANNSSYYSDVKLT